MNRRALPAASSPRGLSFLQGSRVGLASYHFGPSGDGAEGSHISYAAADPSWRLDDGSAPPPRVPFLEPTYDAVTRACRGASSPANLGGSSADLRRFRLGDAHFPRVRRLVADFVPRQRRGWSARRGAWTASPHGVACVSRRAAV